MNEAKLKILLVTDSEDSYFSINSELSNIHNFKFKLFWARSLAQAVDQLNSNYDICLFDDKSLQTATYEFLGKIKTDNIQLPVIILSDGLSKDRDIRLLRAGASDYLVWGKIRADFLHRAISYACERTSTNTDLNFVEKEQLREQKLISIGELASNISAQLGTNLEKISDSISFLKSVVNDKSKWDQEELEKRIRISEKNIEKSRKFIENLRTLSQNELKIIPKSNLSKIVLDTTDFLNKANKSDSTVMTVLDTDIDLQVNLNPSDIKQALTNIVTNSIEAQPDGGLIKITLSSLAPDELPPIIENKNTSYALISIQDSGIGIEPNGLNSIFEPTFTSKKRKHKFGFGLTIVYNIIKAHKGYITIDSTLNVGTLVKIYLPLAGSKTPSKTGTKGMVLVIEPDVSQHEVCKLYFAAAGLDARVFKRTTNALTWYQKNWHRVDLIMNCDEKNVSLDNSINSALVTELRSFNPNSIIVSSDFSFTSKESSHLLEAGFEKLFPSESRYLSAISWVSEGLGWNK